MNIVGLLYLPQGHQVKTQPSAPVVAENNYSDIVA